MDVFWQYQADPIARADTVIHEESSDAIGAIIELRVGQSGAVRIDSGLTLRKAACAGFQIIA